MSDTGKTSPAFRELVQKAKDAWSMRSWIIYPDNERGPVTPEKLVMLADELDDHGVDGGAVNWPGALRIVAAAWADAKGCRLDKMHRCPACMSRDIRITAEVVCRLTTETSSKGVYDAAVVVDDPEPYWDNDTVAVCQACDHMGEVRDFKPLITVSDLAQMEALNATT
ncbi:MAG: hypothetical protein AAFV69_00355 [Pseudomonadota bacterium]